MIKWLFFNRKRKLEIHQVSGMNANFSGYILSLVTGPTLQSESKDLTKPLVIDRNLFDLTSL